MQKKTKGGVDGGAEEVRVGGVCRDKKKKWFQPKREEMFFWWEER